MSWTEHIPDDELLPLLKALHGSEGIRVGPYYDVIVDEVWRRSSADLSEWPIGEAPETRLYCPKGQSPYDQEHRPRQATISDVRLLGCSCGVREDAHHELSGVEFGTPWLHWREGTVCWPLEGRTYLVCSRAKFADDPAHTPIVVHLDPSCGSILCGCGHATQYDNFKRMEAY